MFDPELHEHLKKEIGNTTAYKTEALGDNFVVGSWRSKRREKREHTKARLAFHAQNNYTKGCNKQAFAQSVKKSMKEEKCGSFMFTITIIYYILRLIIAYKNRTSS